MAQRWARVCVYWWLPATRLRTEGQPPATSRRLMSPRFIVRSMTTVASSWRRGPCTHASSPSTSNRARASSGFRRTCGPRSESATRVPTNDATRSIRLRLSSGIRLAEAADGDVTIVEPHDEPPAVQDLEDPLRLRGSRAERDGDVGRHGTSQLVHLLPGHALTIVHLSHDVRAVVGLQHERETVTLEHRLDGVPVIVGHASEQEVRLARVGVLCHVLQQELGDDFIRAG